MDKVISVNRLDTHDRLLQFQKQADNVGEMCSKIIAQRPFGNHPFYIFAHARTADDGVTKRLIWQPRLTKPKSQTNSMLFKVHPLVPEEVKVIWMIPDRAMWSQFKKGLVTESTVVERSIQAFEENRDVLDAPERDDLTDSEVDGIYRELASGIQQNDVFKKLNDLESSDGSVD